MTFHRHRLAAFSLLLVIAAGCPQAPSPLPKPDDPPPAPIVSGLAADVRTARDQATANYGEHLERIAADVESGAIKYDTKLQLELNQAQRESSKPIQDLLGRVIPKGEITDRRSTAQQLREFRDGYQSGKR